MDSNTFRENIVEIKELLANKRGNSSIVNVERWLELDSQRSKLIKEIENLRSQRNNINSEIKSKPSESVILQMNNLKASLEELEKELVVVESEWSHILEWSPNLRISKSAMPNGLAEEDNLIDKLWTVSNGYLIDNYLSSTTKLGQMPNTLVSQVSPHWDKSDLTPQHHLDLAEKNGWIDNLQAAKISGTRFTYLFGELSLLQYALQQFLFKKLFSQGFEYIIPPLLVKNRSLFGTSHFPEGENQVYKIKSDYLEEKEELNLVGSSEPTNFSFFADKVVDLSNGPIKVFAYTPCFRTEVGSWGRDVRGIKRVHQFDKIEMNAVCKPSDSDLIFKEFLCINEWILQSLEISYRLTRKCSADAGYMASAEQVDTEAWLPGQAEFIEVGTDTNTTDYQARRLNIKYLEGGKKEFVHTVNDTGMPMGRILIAILDNYQQSDRSIKVPKVLIEFVGKEYIGKK